MQRFWRTSARPEPESTGRSRGENSMQMIVRVGQKPPVSIVIPCVQWQDAIMISHLLEITYLFCTTLTRKVV